MKIYEYNAEIENLIDEETGEILDYELFEKLAGERDEKIENLILYYKDLLGDAEKIKAEKNNLAERESACKKRAESIKGYLEYLLQGSAFQTERVAVSYRASEAVEVDKDLFIGEGNEFATHKEEWIPDKTKIKKALKEGIEVKGCTLVQRQNIQIK